jgi:hypothetical protein
LCDISNKGQWKAVEGKGPYAILGFCTKKDPPIGYCLPDSLQKQLRISEELENVLIYLNDENGTWAKVIDVLENKMTVTQAKAKYF